VVSAGGRPRERSGQFNLGARYDAGEGVAKDSAEAVKWYRLAADQGDVVAQFNLGVKYSTGEGVAKDDSEAIRWYRRAADQGDAMAQFNLGLIYYTGVGRGQGSTGGRTMVSAVGRSGECPRPDQPCLLVCERAGRGKDNAKLWSGYRGAADQG